MDVYYVPTGENIIYDRYCFTTRRGVVWKIISDGYRDVVISRITRSSVSLIITPLDSKSLS
jgi:hypothetical protein